MKIIAGLGNPGKQYEHTRHNAGFRVIDELSGGMDIPVIRSKHKALVGEKISNGEKIMLVKPMTYMNLSGLCIKEIISFYKADISDLIVIYDDCALPVGSIRLRERGSDGGHNGITNIISHLGTMEFARVRIGVGERPQGWIMKDFVLSMFTEAEKAEVEKSIKDAADCVNMILHGHMSRAMAKYNKKVKKPDMKTKTENNDGKGDALDL